MATEFCVKVGDTRPSISAQLFQDGSAVDLDGATVRFNMRNKNLGNATIVTASEGRVRYDWSATDLEKKGIHRAEFEVTFSDGGIESFPNAPDSDDTPDLVIVVTEAVA